MSAIVEIQTEAGTTVRLATLPRFEARVSAATGGFEMVGGRVDGFDFVVAPYSGRSFKTRAGAVRGAVRWLESRSA